MRKSIKIPPILKVQDVQGMALNLVFNNGKSRNVDFDKFLSTLKLNPASPANRLKKPVELRKFTLTQHSLYWENIQLSVRGRDGEKMTVPFEVGADTLYDTSELLKKV